MPIDPIPVSSTTLMRVRTAGIVLLAHDLKILISRLIRVVKRLCRHWSRQTCVVQRINVATPCFPD